MYHEQFVMWAKENRICFPFRKYNYSRKTAPREVWFSRLAECSLDIFSKYISGGQKKKQDPSFKNVFPSHLSVFSAVIFHSHT